MLALKHGSGGLGWLMCRSHRDNNGCICSRNNAADLKCNSEAMHFRRDRQDGTGITFRKLCPLLSWLCFWCCLCLQRLHITTEWGLSWSEAQWERTDGRTLRS